MISMGRLRREVVSPVPGWRKPHALAGLFFASLLFATSLDALLISYRLRLAELDRVEMVEQRRPSAADEVEAELRRSLAEQEILIRELRSRRLRGDFPAPPEADAVVSGCGSRDPLSGL
jgi:hypothetical protein